MDTILKFKLLNLIAFFLIFHIDKIFINAIIFKKKGEKL